MRKGVPPQQLFSPCNDPLLFVIPPAPACRGTGAHPDFLPRSPGQDRVCAFFKERRMLFDQRHQLTQEIRRSVGERLWCAIRRPTFTVRRHSLFVIGRGCDFFIRAKNDGCRCGTAPRLGNCSLPATTLSYLSSRLPRRAVGPKGSDCAPFGRPTFTVRRRPPHRHPERSASQICRITKGL
jgi:hypothetical protein